MSIGTTKSRFQSTPRKTIRKGPIASAPTRYVASRFRLRGRRRPLVNFTEADNDREMAFVARSAIVMAALGMLPLIVFLAFYYLNV